MRRSSSIFLFVYIIALVAMAIWAPKSEAFDTYSSENPAATSCATVDGCHGNFLVTNFSRASQDPEIWSGSLHSVHQGMVGFNCNACHSNVSPEPFGKPVLLNHSNGAPATSDPISCLGCHGRAGDNRGTDSRGNPVGDGAGLRQHHWRAGEVSCSICHSEDSNPQNFIPVGENFAPPWYSTLGWTACNGDGSETFAGSLGLDNDGDSPPAPQPDVYDTNDPDCEAANQPPVADPNGPYTGVVGVAVMFDGTGSSDPDGTIVSYDWDFGDGATGTGAQPQHTYATAGVYDVTLTVTDDAGDTSDPVATTATIDPTNQAPTADPNGPYTGTVGVPVTFDGSGSNDPDGTIVSYDWDFGDGATGTGVSPTHTYATDGVFTVSLTVTDDASATDSATTTATIGLGNQPPVADPNGPYTGTVGVPVAFDGTGSNDPDGSIDAYDWDFGDGTVVIDAGPTPTHTYAAEGLYNVTLTVTDDEGAIDSAGTTADIVEGNQRPVADPNGPYTGTAGTPVTFDGSGSSDPDGTIASYDWDFGDGATGTGVSPTHTYATDGVFTVSLTVTDDVGDTSDPATTTATIGAVNQPPVADPNGPYTGVVDVAVMFDGTGSNDPDGTIVSYDWDFGDGAIGTGPQPQHAYAAPGVYDVTLTVMDDAGDTSDPVATTATIDPANQAPTADPNGPYSGTVGVPVTFDGSGSSDPDGTIVSYDWDFGDSTTGTGVGPTHTYATDGVFTVTLTVTDNAGATSAPATTLATIAAAGNLPPVADPNGPYSGTVGVPVAFDGSGSSDPDGTIVSYDWDFGDGTTGTGVSPTHTYATAGTYNVTLEVTDDVGASDSAMTTATINPAGLIEAEVEAPGAINGANRGRIPIKIELDEDGMPVEIAELVCGGDVSNAEAMPERIDAEDGNENEFTALFRTRDLQLVCEDTAIVCTGTLADGRTFEGMDEIRVVRDVEGDRCK